MESLVFSEFGYLLADISVKRWIGDIANIYASWLGNMNEQVLLLLSNAKQAFHLQQFLSGSEYKWNS